MIAEQSAYKIFAANLFSRVTAAGTIAKVCRDLDINRQQFNKYLSGSTLPSGEILCRISKYFDVPEYSWFMPDGKLIGPDAGEGSPLQAKSRELLAALEKSISHPPVRNLREGCYFVYFKSAHPARRDKIMRAVLKFSNVSGVPLFSRLTRFRPRADMSSFSQQSRHDGVVLASLGATYFVGRARSGLHEVSVLAFVGVGHSIIDLSSGVAIIVGAGGKLVANRVALDYAGPPDCVMRLRKQIGEVDRLANDLPENLLEILEAPTQQGCHYLTPVGPGEK